MLKICVLIICLQIYQCLSLQFFSENVNLMTSDLNWQKLLYNEDKVAESNTTMSVCRGQNFTLQLDNVFCSTRNFTFVTPPDAVKNVQIDNSFYHPVLRFYNTSDKNIGWYYCVVNLFGGRLRRHDIYIDVQDCPNSMVMTYTRDGKSTKASILTSNSTFKTDRCAFCRSKIANIHVLLREKQPLGSAATISCRTDGPVKRMYFHDGLKEINSDNSTDVNTISLTIQNIGPRECGFYTCVAEMYGSTSHRVYFNSNALAATVEISLDEYDMDNWNKFSQKYFKVRTHS